MSATQTERRVVEVCCTRQEAQLLPSALEGENYLRRRAAMWATARGFRLGERLYLEPTPEDTIRAIYEVLPVLRHGDVWHAAQLHAMQRRKAIILPAFEPPLRTRYPSKWRRLRIRLRALWRRGWSLSTGSP